MLGSRNAVKALASRSLHNGQNVIIDRTNVDESQRATWVDLGKSFPNVEVQAFVFQTPLQVSLFAIYTLYFRGHGKVKKKRSAEIIASLRKVCKARLTIRTDHETIHDPNRALKILDMFHRDFINPRHSEGFSKIIFIYPKDFQTALATRSEIDDILLRAKQAPVVNETIVRSPPPPPPLRLHRESRGAARSSGDSWRARGGGGRGEPYQPEPYYNTLSSNSWRDRDYTNRFRGAADGSSWRGQGQQVSQSVISPSIQRQHSPNIHHVPTAKPT